MSDENCTATSAAARELVGIARLLAWARTAMPRLAGWRRALVAGLCGVVAVAALPPLYIWPALVPAFTILFWLVESSPHRRGAFLAGWWFGFAYFTAGLYWIANAFLVRGEQFAWLAPFAVLALAAFLAVYIGLVGLFTRMSGIRGIGGVLVFAALWTAFEWIRGWALTGFPWNLVGTAWAFSEAMIQVTALTGTYGLGLLTVVAAAMPAALADPTVRRRSAMLAVGASFAVILAVWAGGIVRLALAGELRTVPDVRLRLVQPNIPQRLKWVRGLLDQHLLTQLRLGAAPGRPPPTHIIWAETAAPLFLGSDAGRLAMIGQFTPPGGLTIVGTLRRTPAGQPFQVWNSMQAVDDGGRVVGTYDKAHLVPFGEYVPFRSILGISKITAGMTDFSRGPGPKTLALPGLPPVSPLICYEVIFPGRVTDHEHRPGWLLNLTNDGWYGLSSGPYQHFAAARMRTVEEGLPLVRVANTGISAIVDPYGRTVASLGLGEKGIVDGPLPAALKEPPPYARYREWIVFAMVAITAGSALCFGAGERV